MSRVPRFEEFRFVGARDSMTVYDCDVGGQLGELMARLERDPLLSANLLQGFAPDTITEAQSRGFRVAT